MNKKRIALISYHTCPLAIQEGVETGGMNIYVLELAKELVKIGYGVDVFTRCQDEAQGRLTTLHEGFRVIHLIAGPQKSIANKKLLSYIDEFIENFYKFTKEENVSYDVLDCHYYLSGLIGLKLQETLHLPLTITFHTLALMKNLVARTEKEMEEQERVDAEFLLVQKAQKIIAPSENDSSYLHYLYGASNEKISIIMPGVDTSFFHPIDKKEAKEKIGAEIDHKIVLFVGRIEPLKGIDVLLYAMKILLEKNPSFCTQFYVVGGDISQQKKLWSVELQKLETLRHTLGIKQNVSLVGRKNREELRYYYNASEVVVMPSLYESFGMTALEAMSCGIPVITTDATGVSSIIDEKHQSLITSASNPLLLAEQIENLLTDEEKYKRISTDVLSQVKDLTWDEGAKRIDKVFSSL